jgi:hypothetical protein
MRANALSISPILVIDDNIFERVYIRNFKNKNDCTHIKYYKNM